jgi:hypothetical protein
VTAIIITAIICATLVSVFAIATWASVKQKGGGDA